MGDLHLEQLHPGLYSRETTKGIWPDLRDAAGSVLGSLHDDIAGTTELWDIATCPVQYLRYLAQKVGWTLDETASEALQRKVLSLIVALYRRRGTPPGLVEVMRLLLGIEATVRAPWTDGRRVGRSRTGSGHTAGAVTDDGLAPAADGSNVTARPLTCLVTLPTRAYTADELAQAEAVLALFKWAPVRLVLLAPYLDTPPDVGLGAFWAGWPADDRAPEATWRAWGEEPPRRRSGRSRSGLARTADLRMPVQAAWGMRWPARGQVWDLAVTGLWVLAVDTLRAAWTWPVATLATARLIVRSDREPTDYDDTTGAEVSAVVVAGAPGAGDSYDWPRTSLPSGLLHVGIFTRFADGSDATQGTVTTAFNS